MYDNSEHFATLIFIPCRDQAAAALSDGNSSRSISQFISDRFASVCNSNSQKIWVQWLNNMKRDRITTAYQEKNMKRNRSQQHIKKVSRGSGKRYQNRSVGDKSTSINLIDILVSDGSWRRI